MCVCVCVCVRGDPKFRLPLYGLSFPYTSGGYRAEDHPISWVVLLCPIPSGQKISIHPITAPFDSVEHV